ncbi:hypothetical protein D3C74_455400 [compost metagenome]
MRGAGEWWLGHHDDPDTPDRDELTERVAAWLWGGPVGVMARGRGAAAAGDAAPAARDDAPDGVAAPDGAAAPSTDDL